MSEELKMIKQALITQVQNQMSNLECVDAKELGEVIDMVKDLEEAAYYCAITKSMEKLDEEKENEIAVRNNYYYTEYPYYPHPKDEWERDLEWKRGRMYYGDGGTSGSSSSMSGTSGNATSSSMGNRYYTEYDYPLPMRDRREGRSPVRRKMYMESKEMHQDSSKSIKELESYMQELTSDLMEMIEKASPEEKLMLQKKVENLSTKLQNV